MQVFKSKIWFVITIFLGIVTSLLVANYLKGIEQRATQEGITATVVVATKKIPQGIPVTTKMIKTVQMPIKYAPKNAFTHPNQVANKFTTVALWPEDILTKEKLVSANISNDLTYKIPEGNRAITIAVNPVSGVANLIKPGHYVDILFTYKSSSDKQENNNTIIMLQRVMVLAVGTDLNQKDEAQVSENITLSVTPQEATFLTLAETTGKLKLTLRPARDEETVQTNSINLQRLQTIFP